MGDDLARVHVWVSGRVQGVFFRAETQRAARDADVTGWVRNLSGGGVEAVFEGRPEAVATALAWIRHGPERAVVTDVTVRDESPEGLAGFEIRH